MLLYNIKLHTFYQEKNATALLTVISDNCYSGAPGFLNDPTKCSVKQKGPLPPNFYHIGPAYTHSVLGPIVMNLTPIGIQPMYDRDDFRIHGDNQFLNHSASEGCIVTTHGIRLFIVQTRETGLQVITGE